MNDRYANTEHKFVRLPNTTLGIYNAWDTYFTAQLAAALLSELRDAGQSRFYETLVEPLQPAVLAMQAQGIRVDPDALDALRTRVTRELGDLDRGLIQFAKEQGYTPGPKFITSKDQLGEFLFGKLELRAAKTTAKRGRPSVDQDSLTRVLRDLRKRDEHARTFLEDLFHRSRLWTIRTRYLRFTVDPDGRVRPTVKLVGTKTGRYAYEDPALQQFPEECRHIFVSPPGFSLVSADYSQLEARSLAYQAGAARLIEVFESGADIHKLNAMDLLGLSEADWAAIDKPKPYRNLAKAFFYRKVYGGTIASGDKKLFCPCPRCADKVPATVSLSADKAREAEERWTSRNPEVALFQHELEQFVARYHYFEPVMGGRRYMSKPPGKDLWRELANAPHQTFGARLMNRAQIRLYEQGLVPLFQQHDSFVFEVRDGDVADAVKLIRREMQEPVHIRGRYVSFPVDLSVGRNWGEASPANPEGLRPYGG